MMPSLQTPRGKLAFLYNETGRRKEACRIAHKILTEDVKVYGFNTFKLHRDLKVSSKIKLNNCQTNKKNMKNIRFYRKWNILVYIGILCMLLACADHMLQGDGNSEANQQNQKMKN